VSSLPTSVEEDEELLRQVESEISLAAAENQVLGQEPELAQGKTGYSYLSERHNLTDFRSALQYRLARKRALLLANRVVMQCVESLPESPYSVPVWLTVDTRDPAFPYLTTPVLEVSTCIKLIETAEREGLWSAGDQTVNSQPMEQVDIVIGEYVFRDDLYDVVEVPLARLANELRQLEQFRELGEPSRIFLRRYNSSGDNTNAHAVTRTSPAHNVTGGTYATAVVLLNRYGVDFRYGEYGAVTSRMDDQTKRMGVAVVHAGSIHVQASLMSVATGVRYTLSLSCSAKVRWSQQPSTTPIHMQ
jgi:hypothetical protein